jgi:AraC-like DNA-binding protein
MQRVNIALQELKSGRAATDVALDNGYESLSGFGYIYKRLTGATPTQIIVIHRFTTTLGLCLSVPKSRGECACWSLPITECQRRNFTISSVYLTPGLSQVKIVIPDKHERNQS